MDRSTTLHPINARASPGGDAHWPRPTSVTNGRGLPVHGRGRLKKLVQPATLRIATLNIGTLTGRSRELAELLKRRRVDIACIQETRWKGQKSRDIGDGYKLIYHGTTNTKGVAIAVSEDLRSRVAEVHRHSDRLMSVVIDADNRRLHIYSAYAPQTGCDEDEKDRFWRELHDHISSCPAEDLLLLGGDLNGHVGSARDGYNCHGGNGYGTRNDDGRRILDFAEATDLIIANTFFQKRTSHLITYTSRPNTSQIDFILLRKRDFPAVVDTKVIPSDCLAPQHKLVVTDLRVSVRRRANVTGPATIKWWKLHKQKAAIVNGITFPTINLDAVDTVWAALRDSATATARVALGTRKPGRRQIDKQTWLWTDEVQEKVRAKKVAFKKWHAQRTDENCRGYKAAKKEAKRTVAAARADHHRDLYERLDTAEGEKTIYQLARARTKAALDIEHYKCVKNKDGRRLQGTREIRRRWQQHFDEISNVEFPHPPIPDGPSFAGPVCRITTAEVERAIIGMKNAKAPGPDDLPADLWKLKELRGTATAWLTDFFNAVVETGRAPADWSTSITVPIFKNKGDPATCSNYRPIRLLCHTMKILERILNQRLREVIRLKINQCGFVKGTGTTDAIFAARQLMEKHRERKQPLHLAFLDLEKAFDRVPHQLIWYALRDHEVPELLINWVRLLYVNATSRVRCSVGTSGSFPVRVGVHQGSALSPLLFILVMDTITRDLQDDIPWTLLYADDVLLAAKTKDELQQRVQTWSDRFSQFGLRLNITKTEYMETVPSPDSIKVNDEDLTKTSMFRYLGSHLQSNGDIDGDVRARVNGAWMRWREVTGVLCDRKMPIRLKSKIYRTVVRPVALYGTESWPTTRTTEQRLHAMEMRMVRWIMGISLLDHMTNDTLRRRFGIAPIDEKMREGRLRWFGHVTRAAPGTVASVAYSLDVGGQRPRGRPKQRWQDTINADMKTSNLHPRDALDRAKWRVLIQRADPAMVG